MQQARKRVDTGMKWLLYGAAVSSVFILIGILLMLFINGLHLFKDAGLWDFVFGNYWNPGGSQVSSYGIGAMITGTLLTTFGSLAIALPLGIATAAGLVEFTSSRLASIIKPLIELLASVPSVTIGFIGIVWVGPLISRVFGTGNGLNALNGSILLAVMSLPTIITVAEDAIRSVSGSYKEASLALGASRFHTLVFVTLPACYSGLIAAGILGMGRAIGETMTVLMAAGNATEMPSGFLDPVRTLTATIAIELGEVPYFTTHYYALFAVGAVLFVITLFVNILAERVAARYKKLGR